MKVSNITTATANTARRATESSLMGIAATSNIIARVFNKIEEKSFDQAVIHRATRKNIRRDEAAHQLMESHKATLSNIDAKYAKLKSIVPSKKVQPDVVPDGKVWEPKLV